MTNTRLILHVRGTESETRELPKADVKAAVAEGKMSYSQLIWVPAENAWKQVRELPDLLPVENLILHVKGTQSETREMPKQAVKNAISRGEITHSQLIWSATDATWKQVREIPELLPGETMIVHVKGTESEMRELPKPAIRAAIQKGEITHSQLIWSPLDSAWKPVREMPDLVPGESLILHVKGSTSETKEMPKKAIRTAIKEGQITHSQLIWSADEHQWKQVRDLPELLPSQKLAPAPVPRPHVPMLPSAEPGAAPVAVARALPVATPKARPAVAGPPRAIPSVGKETPGPTIAQPAVAVAGTAVPAVRVASAAPVPASAPRVAVATAPRAAQAPMAAVVAPEFHPPAGPHEGHIVNEEDDVSNPVRWVCIILGALLALLVAANFFLIDWPLSSSLGKTSYANVFAYGHYGAFIQPNVIVIHIPPSEKLTPDNITDFLVALAHSTPRNPLTNDYFDRIALTSGWTSQYSFSGLAWMSLGEMKAAQAEDIRTRILSTGCDAIGQPLLGPSTLNETAKEAAREKAWKQLVANFTKSGS